jgi:hypothetical protein
LYTRIGRKVEVFLSPPLVLKAKVVILLFENCHNQKEGISPQLGAQTLVTRLQ